MTVATVTKSIRLLPEEAEELASLTRHTASTEAALMKKWVLQGMHAHKIDYAIKAYMQREVDLRSGAAMAGVSYNRFLREAQAHNIVILENEHFLDHLTLLADAFESETLREAVATVSAPFAEIQFDQNREL